MKYYECSKLSILVKEVSVEQCRQCWESQKTNPFGKWARSRAECVKNNAKFIKKEV